MKNGSGCVATSVVHLTPLLRGQWTGEARPAIM
jgi:hypothetical protein